MICLALRDRCELGAALKYVDGCIDTLALAPRFASQQVSDANTDSAAHIDPASEFNMDFV
jgi:hypothetical protein